MAKRDEDGDARLDKTAVLQETRAFHESAQNPRRSRLLLGKVLALLALGDQPLSRAEATALFFATTKLFQSRDAALRQCVYLTIKELADKADDVLMVTSSLTKDMNAKPEDLFGSPSPAASLLGSFGLRFGSSSSSSGGSGSSPSAQAAANLMMGGGSPGTLLGTNVSHRANAIRALCAVTEPAMLAAVDRFLKQAIVDKSAAVSSAALVSAYHAFLKAPAARDIVRRWANEVAEAMSQPKLANPNAAPAFAQTAYMVQYHALGLLYLIRQQDRMAVAKLVQQAARGGTVRSAWAQCMLVRFAAKCCDDEAQASGGRCMVGTPGSISQAMYDYLKGLCSAGDMVMVEAARALCGMVTRDPQRSLTAAQVQPAIQALQSLLTSPKPVLKFAALRTLNSLALINPSLVAPCNLDMENLVSDPNRSIATFAITTLLKTGTESSVDQLMKQISTFMTEISDEFKVIVVDAIRVLAVKFPAKQSVMLGFLSSILRDEGGYEYKKAVVEAIFDLVKSLPECLEAALAHLCEFIEDCEFTKLAVRILYLVGHEGPKTPQPRKYIRYIYNRVILENSNVRAAAVGALAALAAAVPDVRDTARTLLHRCMDDADDEVRDRAVLYAHMIDDESLRSAYLADPTVLSTQALYLKAQHAAANPAPVQEWAAHVPRVPKADVMKECRRAASPIRRALNSPLEVSPTSAPAAKAAAAASAPMPTAGLPPTHFLATHPDFATFAPTHIKTGLPVHLTDKEMEYVVTVTKHVFAQHIVFEFGVTNTVPDALLENVSVVMQPDEPVDHMLRPLAMIPCPKVECGQPEPGKIWVCYARAPQVAVPAATFTTALKYVVKDCDPVTHVPDSADGYDDQYSLEDVNITLGDFMLPSAVGDFSAAWASLGNEVVETFQVEGIPTVGAAVAQVMALVGMMPVENSGEVTPADKATHLLMLSGVFAGGARVLARIRLAAVAGGAVAMELAVRSDAPEVTHEVVAAIQG